MSVDGVESRDGEGGGGGCTRCATPMLACRMFLFSRPQNSSCPLSFLAFFLQTWWLGAPAQQCGFVQKTVTTSSLFERTLASSPGGDLCQVSSRDRSGPTSSPGSFSLISPVFIIFFFLCFGLLLQCLRQRLGPWRIRSLEIVTQSSDQSID